MISENEYFGDLKSISAKNDQWIVSDGNLEYSGNISIPDFENSSEISDSNIPLDDAVETIEPNARIQIIIEFCSVFSVPTIFFEISTNSESLPPEWIWKNIFNEKDFIGKISFEASKSGRRMIRLHPCTTAKILTGLSNSPNKTASLLNILLQTFIKLDKNIFINF